MGRVELKVFVKMLIGTLLEKSPFFVLSLVEKVKWSKKKKLRREKNVKVRGARD